VTVVPGEGHDRLRLVGGGGIFTETLAGDEVPPAPLQVTLYVVVLAVKVPVSWAPLVPLHPVLTPFAVIAQLVASVELQRTVVLEP